MFNYFKKNLTNHLQIYFYKGTKILSHLGQFLGSEQEKRQVLIRGYTTSLPNQDLVEQNFFLHLRLIQE